MPLVINGYKLYVCNPGHYECSLFSIYCFLAGTELEEWAIYSKSDRNFLTPLGVGETMQRAITDYERNRRI